MTFKRMATNFAACVVLLVGSAFAPSEKDHDIICRSIRNGEAVEIWYRAGEPKRIFLPRLLITSKAGNVILNGWQVGGYSRSGLRTNYAPRSFRLDRITAIKVTGEHLEAPKIPVKVPTWATQVICQLELAITPAQ